MHAAANLVTLAAAVVPAHAYRTAARVCAGVVLSARSPTGACLPATRQPLAALLVVILNGIGVRPVHVPLAARAPFASAAAAQCSGSDAARRVVERVVVVCHGTVHPAAHATAVRRAVVGAAGLSVAPIGAWAGAHARLVAIGCLLVVALVVALAGRRGRVRRAAVVVARRRRLLRLAVCPVAIPQVAALLLLLLLLPLLLVLLLAVVAAIMAAATIVAATLFLVGGRGDGVGGSIGRGAGDRSRDRAKVFRLPDPSVVLQSVDPLAALVDARGADGEVDGRT